VVVYGDDHKEAEAFEELRGLADSTTHFLVNPPVVLRPGRTIGWFL